MTAQIVAAHAEIATGRQSKTALLASLLTSCWRLSKSASLPLLARLGIGRTQTRTAGLVIRSARLAMVQASTNAQLALSATSRLTRGKAV